MESTPVSGVATRNEAVAPFDAPALRTASAVGMTPQEHSGNGAPINAPLVMDSSPGLASCFCTHSLGITCLITPAMK